MSLTCIRSTPRLCITYRKDSTMGADMLLAGMRAPWKPDTKYVTDMAEIQRVGVERIARVDLDQLDWESIAYYVANTMGDEKFEFDVRYEAEPEPHEDLWRCPLNSEEEERVVRGEELDVLFRQALIRALEIVLTHGRDVADYTMPNGDVWWFSGGLSWGDDPTDSYEPINLLGQIDLFEQAMPSE